MTEADYFAVIDGKTAALTECCGRLGALYAGAGDAAADRLADFGRNLGLAFQVADDLLDLTGEEQTAGKTLGTDLAQQKLTLHGQTHPVRVEVIGMNGHYHGTAQLKQKDFGIAPISLGGGTVKVKNELRVEFDVVGR